MLRRRRKLSEIDNVTFDIAIIGGGIHGASAARHLSAAGYSVVLLEKNDFGTGSSSRSSRVMASGLKSFDTGEPLYRMLAHPLFLLRAMKVARNSLKGRSELARTVPNRVVPFRCFLPVFGTDRFPPWQLKLGLKVLETLNPPEVPLDVRNIPLSDVAKTPLLSFVRRQDLRAVSSMQEYYFNWSERIVVDCVLDAYDMGAACFNYASVEGLKRTTNGTWQLNAYSTLDASDRASLHAKFVLNTAGIWIDEVNKLAGGNPRRRIKGTKGAHIVVKLPESCIGHGMINSMRDSMPGFLVPFRNTHHYGPTDVPYDGDIDDIHVTEKEVDYLLAELNHLLPTVGLDRKDVVGTWAGVRPWTNEPQPRAKSILDPVYHDMEEDEMPGVVCLTGAAISSHRRTGRKLVEVASKYVKPSKSSQAIDYAKTFTFHPSGPGSSLDNSGLLTKEALIHAAQTELPATLTDLLHRRLGYEYDAGKGVAVSSLAAEAVSETLGWDQTETQRQANAHRDEMNRVYQPR